MFADLKLDSTLPWINLIPYAFRQFKTASSERKVPFTGLLGYWVGHKASKTAVLKTILLSSLTYQ